MSVTKQPAGRGAVVEVAGVSQYAGRRRILQDFWCTINRNESLALLGPNGAGKTTVLEIVLGLRKPSSGRVRIVGVDPTSRKGSWQPHVGAALQSASVSKDLRVRQAVELHASYHTTPWDARGLLVALDLSGVAEGRVEKLSGGESRKLELAIALVGQPKLLVLDEPTATLDPIAQRTAWKLIGMMQKRGASVLLATQSFAEAEALSEHVAILVDGRVERRMSADEWTNKGSPRLHFTLGETVLAAQMPPRLRAAPAGDGGFCAQTPDINGALLSLASWASFHGVSITDVYVRKPCLKEIYLDTLLSAEDRTRGASVDCSGCIDFDYATYR